jgi:hypothetical protein
MPGFEIEAHPEKDAHLLCTLLGKYYASAA